jgi:hypothetical protein
MNNGSGYAPRLAVREGNFERHSGLNKRPLLASRLTTFWRAACLSLGPGRPSRGSGSPSGFRAPSCRRNLLENKRLYESRTGLRVLVFETGSFLL